MRADRIFDCHAREGGHPVATIDEVNALLRQ
jgi:hypothetical protein